MNENIENKRKQLIFRSWHRGTKEMDLILGSFANKNLPKFNAKDLEVYEDLLMESDPNLYNWVSGREDVPEDKKNHVLELLLKHQYNTER